MNIPAEFDEIRPYAPEELPQLYAELEKDEMFKKAMTSIFPQLTFEQFSALLHGCKTNEEVQVTFCKPFLQGIIKHCSTGITADFGALDNKYGAYTFISNHRDIVLDSALLCLLEVLNDMKTVEIAIGDNLLIYPWIKTLVRINKSFIVQRALTMREMLASSARLSRYIHFVISEKENPVWIAQREGRAKNSDDRTQESVIKMLAMGGEGGIIERLRSLNIVPISITYEYDPCDYLKAQEFQLKRDNADYKKSPKDDLINMQTGMFGFKGKIHYHAAECINKAMESLDTSLPKNELLNNIAALVDKGIHSNYVIHPINYYAYGLLTGDAQFKSKLSVEEEKQLENYFIGQLNKIELPNKDECFLMGKLLEMYANPLNNYLKATT